MYNVYPQNHQKCREKAILADFSSTCVLIHIQRLEEELEKKDRSNDLYDKLKEAEKEQKKAEEDADKYYNQFCDEEAKASKLRDEIRQRNVEIHKLKQDIDGMESQGFVKKDEKAQEEFRMLKKRFTETYSKF